MKLSTEHRKRTSEDNKKKIKDKTPRDLGPEDTTVHNRSEGLTQQLCGDNNVACKWIKWRIFPGDKLQRDNWKDSKDPTLMVEEGSRQADLEY